MSDEVEFEYFIEDFVSACYVDESGCARDIPVYFSELSEAMEAARKWVIYKVEEEGDDPEHIDVVIKQASVCSRVVAGRPELQITFTDEAQTSGPLEVGGL